MPGPRAWTVVDPGFSMSVYDATARPHIVYTYPLIAHWWDPQDQSVWSALVQIGETIVEIDSDSYGELPTPARTGDHPRCMWLNAPEDVPAPDGVQ